MAPSSDARQQSPSTRDSCLQTLIHLSSVADPQTTWSKKNLSEAKAEGYCEFPSDAMETDHDCLQDCLRPFGFMLDRSTILEDRTKSNLHALMTIHEPNHTITAALEMLPPFE
jgi:hypothetical protein